MLHLGHLEKKLIRSAIEIVNSFCYILPLLNTYLTRRFEVYWWAWPLNRWLNSVGSICFAAFYPNPIDFAKMFNYRAWHELISIDLLLRYHKKQELSQKNWLDVSTFRTLLNLYSQYIRLRNESNQRVKEAKNVQRSFNLWLKIYVVHCHWTTIYI